MECFKNGKIFSPKYNSRRKRFDRAKVIVFANFMSDRSALIADRWDIINMDTQLSKLSSGGSDSLNIRGESYPSAVSIKEPAARVDLNILELNKSHTVLDQLVELAEDYSMDDLSSSTSGSSSTPTGLPRQPPGGTNIYYEAMYNLIDDDN